jgi:RHS repeat-associated protein
MNDCELDLATGEVIHQSTDIYLPLAAPLDLTRRYVSSLSQDGLLGWAWIHNFAPIGLVSDQAFTKVNAIDGDTVIAWDECNRVGGPTLALVKDLSTLRRGLRPQPTSEMLSRLRHPAGEGVLALINSDGSREAYLPQHDAMNIWLLREIGDSYGNSVSYEYRHNSLARILTSEGHELRFEYAGRYIAAITLFDLFANTRLCAVHYEYDSNRDLVHCRDAAGTSWNYEYDDHLLVRFRGPNGLSRRYFYDDQRVCIRSEYDGDKRIRLIEGDPLQRRVVVTDTYGLRTLLAFNESGSLIQHTNARGDVSSRLVDENNQLIATMAADGSLEATAVLDPGTNTVLDNVDGCIWKRQLNKSGRIEKIVSPSGLMQTFEYDARGELHRLTMLNGGTFEYGYDDRGNLARVKDPLGYEVIREEVAEQRFVRIMDLNGVLFEQQFDGLGNLLWEKDASGREYRYTYTAVDNLASEIGPSGETSQYTYDGAQNLTARIDGLNRVWRFESDELRRLRAEVDPDGRRIEYEYDLEENLVRIRNEKGEEYQIFRDDLYREIGIRQFDGRELRYELDVLGRRVGITNARGQRRLFSYADASRPIRREFHDGAVEEYALNDEGEHVAITLNVPSEGVERSISFEFDATHRMTREEGEGFVIDYEWNRAASLVAVRDSFGGETTYELDQRYNVARIAEGGRQIELRHLPTGEISHILYPNGLTHKFSYDGSGRMIGRETVAPSGEVRTWRRYEYDAEDQLVAMEDWHWGAFTYTYDRRGRLTTVATRDKGIVESFEYDECGNITESSLGGRASYAPGNRIQFAGDRTFQFDPDGNLLACDEGHTHWQYSWDRDDQLKEVWRDGTRVAAYEYDLTGRRRRKTTREGTSTFLHDIYALRAEQLTSGEIRHYVTLRGLPVPIASWGETGWLYYSYDQIGTPYEVFAESGELLVTFQPHAYGGARREYAPSGAHVHLPFGFMGQYRDEESGLCYNHFRYYDPRLGRYISSDPLGILAGLNFYTYPQNPNTEGDICGLMPTFECLSHWTPCQKAYARAKINAVNNSPASRRQKTCTRCRADAQRRDFKSKRCGKGKIPRGRAIDHMHELQAGGPDRCCANLRAVPKKYNGELGKQTRKMLKGIGLDKTIGRISTTGCMGGPCSQADMDKLAQAPPDTTVQCTEPPLDDNC